MVSGTMQSPMMTPVKRLNSKRRMEYKTKSLDLTQVVLLSCGSFNPVTNAHLRMFELARDHLEATGQYQVVAGIMSPVGDGYPKDGLIEARHRVEMVRRATNQTNWIRVDAWESLQPQWTETVKVMRHHYKELVREHKIDAVGRAKKRRRSSRKSSCLATREDAPRLMLLCGADLLESFRNPDLWDEDDVNEIFGSYGVVCITRHGHNAHKCIGQPDTRTLRKLPEKNIHVVGEWAPNEISSTLVRGALRQGQSIRYLVPDSVIHYINENELYSAESKQNNNN